MDTEKYRRNIPVLCPTCGCSHYEIESGVNETIEIIKCASCGRVFSRDELLLENSESISINLEEVAKETTQDLAKEIKNMLKKSFSGFNSKHVKIQIK